MSSLAEFRSEQKRAKPVKAYMMLRGGHAQGAGNNEAREKSCEL